MKRICLLFVIFLPTTLFCMGNKDKEVYKYLSSIDGLIVETRPEEIPYWKNSFIFEDYQKYGVFDYSNRINRKYKEYLEDNRVVGFLDSGYIHGWQFTILGDYLYWIDIEIQAIKVYSLDSFELVNTYRIINLKDNSEDYCYFSNKLESFFYVSDDNNLIQIDLLTLTIVKRTKISVYDDCNTLILWSDFSFDYVIAEDNAKIVLYDINSLEKIVLLDFTPIVFSKSYGVSDIHILNNGKLQFIFYVSGNSKWVCEYMIPEEYLTSLSGQIPAGL